MPYSEFLAKLVESANEILPTANVTMLNDEDIEAGKLFNSNGNNAFDILILLHEEYATQNTYDSFKKFVANGGALILTESNILTVEIKYNQGNDIITLVRGHKFRLDGNIVTGAEEDRWANETSQWIGSNFLPKFHRPYCHGPRSHFPLQIGVIESPAHMICT